MARAIIKLITKGEDAVYKVYKGTNTTPENSFPIKLPIDDPDYLTAKGEAFEKALKLTRKIINNGDNPDPIEEIIFDSQIHKL